MRRQSSSPPGPGRAAGPSARRRSSSGGAAKLVEAAKGGVGCATTLILGSVGAGDPEGGTEAIRCLSARQVPRRRTSEEQ